jgi:hypothetical protein
MRCKEVKRRISESDGRLDRELLEHISECPSCARAAEAAGILKHAFTAARENELKLSTPFENIRVRIESQAAEKRGKVAIMARFKRQLGARPALVTGFGLAIIAFLFVTLVPFSYTKTIGYNLTCPRPEGESNISADTYEAALETLGFSDVYVQAKEDYYEVANLKSHNAAKQAALTYAALTGSEDEAEIKPVRKKVSGSLYAQAKENYIGLKTKEGTISIEVSGKTDEEIKQAILAKLAAEGWNDADVQVSTDEEGQKWIRIHMGKPDEEREAMLQFNLGESDEDIVLNLGTAATEFEIDIKGKIDEEIRREIVEKLEKRGIIAPEVKIITDSDGQKEIIIKINKDEQK